MPFQGTETLVVLMDEQNGAGLSPRMVVLVADARARNGLNWTGETRPSTPSSFVPCETTRTPGD